jgi:hypothetical protein
MRQTVKSPDADSVVLFPPPPDTTRIQFLTYFSSSTDLVKERGAFKKFLLGEEEARDIIKPYGVSAHKEKVYICDTGLGGMEILDLSRGTFEYFIPGGKGQLQLPINCCLDERGYLYVADARRQQIVVFDQDLKYKHAFGAAENFKPTDVAVYADRILVANVLDHSIYVYGSDDYHLKDKIPDMEPGEEGFIRQCTNLTLGAEKLFVSDMGDFNVKTFSSGGAFLSQVGRYGNHPGSFTRPKGIAVDRDQNLFVVDAAFENVQIFNSRGQLLMHFGGSYGGKGAMWLPAAVEISYENLSYFQPYVEESFELKYLIYVSNQYGPAKVNVYGRVEEKPSSP